MMMKKDLNMKILDHLLRYPEVRDRQAELSRRFLDQFMAGQGGNTDELRGMAEGSNSEIRSIGPNINILINRRRVHRDRDEENTPRVEEVQRAENDAQRAENDAQRAENDAQRVEEVQRAENAPRVEEAQRAEIVERDVNREESSKRKYEDDSQEESKRFKGSKKLLQV
ncbi:hypothetical protein VTJ04DRAFT_10953 [Mycothermus thermophilus]|uniref:uncharacterized protein n=1 Tax=Humicola insolens TaxID=85995 RepID=UPI0037443F87